MNFDFSEDQNTLRESARRFLNDRCPREAVRRILEGGAPFDRDLWRGIAEMGWTGITIPEAHGGLGLGHLDLCVVAEEMGRVLAPVPFASTLYLFAEGVMLAGSADQQATLLPRIAAGDLIGCLALAEGPQAPTPRNIEARVEAGRLTGTKTAVTDGDIAGMAIVAARSGADRGPRGISLYLVDLTGPGVTREVIKTIDPTRSHARISLDGAPAELLGAAGEGWPLIGKLFDRAAVLFAFEQVGGAQVCLDMAKDYALNRYAFGRQIGSFQAIKHKLADMYVAVELARSNAYYGAWALSTDAAELPVAAAGARVAATEAQWLASKENIQVHGGMGYTWETDCHLHYRRAKHLGLALGSSRRWKDALIARLETANATAA